MPIIQAFFYNSVSIPVLGYILYVWGFGNAGAGGGLASTPLTTFAGGTDWKQVSCGTDHTAAIKTDGTLWTWGTVSSTDNRLGLNLFKSSLTITTPVTTAAGGTDWKQVSCGNQHTAAIKTDGTLWTWGNSGSGQLGALDALPYRDTPVTTFAGGTNWADTATTDPSDLYTIGTSSESRANTFAIKTDGTLWGWGSNSNSNVGNGQGTSGYGALTPVTTFAGGTNWRTVSSGYQHTAAIKTDGTLWIWGNPNNGRLGNATTSNHMSTPVTTFAGGTNWKQVACSNRISVAIKTDGTLWTWGEPANGKLGNRVTSLGLSVSTPVTTFAGGTNWKQVSCAYGHVAAIKTDGTLWTWGYSNNGRLGNRTTSPNMSTPVTTFAGGTDWKQVSCGRAHTAAIKTDGTLWLWGSQLYGALANLVSTNTSISTPITTFAGGTNWKQVSCGAAVTAAIKTDGTLWTWGNQTYGMLGNNIQQIGTGASTPVTTFAGGTDWKQVCCAFQHVIALRDDGTNKQIFLWGRNNNQQLGINNYSQFSVSGTNWKEVSASNSSHTAAIKTDGTLWTWGRNADGELGRPGATFIFTPVTTFAGGTNWGKVNCGDNFTTAIKTDGTLWIWGGSREAILGIAATNEATSPPSQISTPITTFAGGNNWLTVSGGGTVNNIVTAIKTDGTLWTWGSNSAVTNGLLGTKSALPYRDTPVTTFAGGTNWADTATTDPSDLYTIFVAGSAGAVKTDGTLWTWGLNNSGQIGNNRVSSGSPQYGVITPVTTFAGGTNWRTISGSFSSFTAAIKTDGTLWAWGNAGNGRLGNGAITSNISTPITTFAGGTDWKQVSAGRAHAAAIKTDGTLWTWGITLNGRLGNRVITGNVSTPITTFSGGNNWKQVSCGYQHTAAVKTDGTLWTWGSTSYGRLGNAVTSSLNFSTPVTTFAGGTNWKQVSCGYLHTAAIKTDGTLWIWGNPTYGCLGNTNITTNMSTPVTTFAGGTNWKQVSASQYVTAAVKTDGTLWTWGNSGNGILGNDGIGPKRSTPITTFAGGTNWKQVSCGYTNMIALQDDGINKQIFLWGRNHQTSTFEFTLGIRTARWTQYQIDGNNWSKVDCKGGASVSAIKTDGTLWNWGAGNLLGINESVNRNTPITTFIGMSTWADVANGRTLNAGLTT